MLRAFLVGILLVVACGESSESVQGATLPSAKDDAGEGRSLDAGCAEGPALSCVCSAGGTGTRACNGTDYGPCEGCSAVQPGQLSKCVAGTYSGTTAGTYRSEPGGLCGIVASPEEHGTGVWSFDLESVGNSEFFSVKAGCVRFGDSAMNDGGTYSGQTAQLIGTVDCITGELKAELRGTYLAVGVCDLGQVWTQYFYKGTLTGKFDPATNSFVGGTYSVKERMPLLGEPAGGSGTWTATLDPQAPPPNAGEDCFAGLPFVEDLTPKPYPNGKP